MAIPKRIVTKQLGQLLLENKIINETRLAEALEVQKEKGGLLGEILVSLGYATEEEIAQVLTIQYGFPYLPLDNYDIEPDTIKLLSADIVKKHGVIPIDKIGTTLTVAMVNPINTAALEEIAQVTKCEIQPFVTTATSFKNAIKKYYGK